MEHLNPKKYQIISATKLGLIVIGFTLLPVNMRLSAICLTIAAVLGIYEELI